MFIDLYTALSLMVTCAYCIFQLVKLLSNTKGCLDVTEVADGCESCLDCQ